MSRWEDMLSHGYAEDDDSDEEGTGNAHKAKPRRKSHQRPQGSDQIRQAFSKRKKGLVLKAYQLNSLTDAKVFMFIVNDKGTSWAYATPGYSSSLNTQVLKHLRSLAEVPEQAKLFTEVIPCPPNAKNPSSRGSSEQTGTQRTDPSTEYVPPSTRTATGSLPSRSRSSYSWGSEGQPQTHQGPDKLTRSSSNAAIARAAQPTPQSDEHSPTLPKARPPSGNSTACGTTRTSMAAVTGYGYQQYLQHPQAAGKGPGMEPPTPCGIYNLLGQPASAQDSPSEVAMSCGGSPSSKLMPPPDAVATGRMMAANAAAAAAAAAGGGQASAATMQGFQMPAMHLKTEPMTGDWAPVDEQAQDAGTSWDLDMYQQQQQQYIQQYMQQQQAYYQQQQQYLQPQHPEGNFLSSNCPGSTDGHRSASVDIPYAAGGASHAAAGVAWGSCPAGLLAATTNTSSEQMQQMQPPEQMQQQQTVSDAFEALQRGLAPLRMAKQYGPPGSEQDGPNSAPAPGAAAATAAAGTCDDFGLPSQWVIFPSSSNTGAAAAGVAGLRTASDAGVYGLLGSQQAYGSYAPSPSSCTNQTSGNGSTSATGAAVQNAAQALLMSRGGTGGLSQSPSPTAALSQRMTSVLAMHSPCSSPMHPSATGEQAQAQQGSSWGQPPACPNSTGSQQQALMGSQGLSSCPASSKDSNMYQQQQGGQQQQQHMAHNQGAYIPQTDDLLSDPIVEMLMDQPLGQLTVDKKAAGDHHRHVSIMEATLAQQQQQQQQGQAQLPPPPPPQQQQGSASPQQEMGSALGAGAGATTGRCITPPWDPPQPDCSSISSLFAHIPPPPKSDARADKAAWQAQVRRMLASLQPQQRQELAKLSEQQWLLAQGTNTPGTNSGLEAADATTAGGSKGPSVFGSCSGPPPPAPGPAAAPAAPSGPSSGGYGRAFGGKQRLGPSRLSSSSPAIDAGAVPVGSGLNGFAAPVSSPYMVSSDGYMLTGNGQQLPLPAVQAMMEEFTSMAQGMYDGAGYPSMPLPAGCSSALTSSTRMSSVDVMVDQSSNPAGMAASQPLPATLLAAAAVSGGFTMSAAVADDNSGCQMLPLPQLQQLSAPVPEPALAGSSPFAAAGGTAGPAASSCFMQPPAGGRAGVLMAEAAGPDMPLCASPLKRSQPLSDTLDGSSTQEGMSPMKRICTSSAMGEQLQPLQQQAQPHQQRQVLPELPSFATLLQAEVSGEDDAIAWAAAAAGVDHMRRVAGSCVSLGMSGALGSMDSLPSTFLRMGSIPGVDSMQLLSGMTDVGSGPGQMGEVERVAEEQFVGGAGSRGRPRWCSAPATGC